MRTNQIMVDGKYVDGNPTKHDEVYQVKIKSGNAYGYETKRHSTAEVAHYREVSMADVGEMLPDSVLVDLEDFKVDKSLSSNKRQAAARISARINSGFKIDVFSTDFEGMMIKLANNTSLTAAMANQIIAKLRS
jgi:hypothetical protein